MSAPRAQLLARRTADVDVVHPHSQYSSPALAIARALGIAVSAGAASRTVWTTASAWPRIAFEASSTIATLAARYGASEGSRMTIGIAPDEVDLGSGRGAGTEVRYTPFPSRKGVIARLLTRLIGRELRFIRAQVRGPLGRHGSVGRGARESRTGGRSLRQQGCNACSRRRLV